MKQTNLLKTIKKEVKELGYSPTLDALWKTDYERKPVDILTFIEDEFYLGKFTKELSPVWKKELAESFASDKSYVTLILTGAIGSGKTTVSAICLLYRIYLLTCMKDPAGFYGLKIKKSKIVFGIFNITLTRGETEYEMLKMWIDESPYFTKHCPRKRKPDDPILLPRKNISIVVGSLFTHALGENLFGFVLDEANFYKKDANKENKSKAHELFIQARTRMISRFSESGKIPGIILLISSKKMQSDFLDQQIKLANEDEEIKKVTRIISFPLWVVKPQEKFCGQTFSVAVGTDTLPSRILEEDEIVRNQEIIEIPVEYREPFLVDVDHALQDIAGVSTVSSYAYFANQIAIRECIDPNRRHPFNVQTIQNLGVGRNIKVQDFIDRRTLSQIYRSSWTPKIHSTTPRFSHVDIGLTEDRLGLSIGHPFLGPRGMSVYFDLILQIEAPKNSEIDLEEIVKFFEWIRDVGIQVRKITFDRYESKMIIQQLNKKGFEAEQMSIKLDHYSILRRLIYDRQVNYYEYPPLIEELYDLRKTDDKRPNHTEGKHDDVADSVAGTAWHCSEMFESFHNMSSEEVIMQKGTDFSSIIW